MFVPPAPQTGSLKRGATLQHPPTSGCSSPVPTHHQHSQQPLDSTQNQFYSPVHSSPSKMLPHSASSPKIVAGALRHAKNSNVPTPKGSPLRRQQTHGGIGTNTVNPSSNPESPMRQIIEEQWIDGPRMSRAKVAEARHLMREINHVKNCETWIDGPKSSAQSSKSLTANNLPSNVQQPATAQPPQAYGFMDSHKKIMIRQWVENQTSQVFQSVSATHSTVSSPIHLSQQQVHMQQLQQMQQMKNLSYQLSKQKSETEYAVDQHSSSSNVEGGMVMPIGAGLTSMTSQMVPAESLIRNLRQQSNNETDLHSLHSGQQQTKPPVVGSNHSGQDEEDQDSGPSEVPPALPLIDPLGSREISHESLHRIISRHVSRESLAMSAHQQMMADYGLKSTEDDMMKWVLFFILKSLCCNGCFSFTVLILWKH